FLDNDADRRKCFQLAERLADLFDQYQVYRADWLAAWAEGEEVLITARGDPIALPDEQRWQAALWRHVLDDVARLPGQSNGNDALSAAGRAAVHEAFIEHVAKRPEHERPAGLPRRVLVFGISSLPRQSLEVLESIARWTQVLMCVHNPCEHFWSDIVADRELLQAGRNRQNRRQNMPAEVPEEWLHLHAHPLLAAWGKQGRDFIALLDERDNAEARAGYQSRFEAIGQRIDLFESPIATTLLQQLQDDIRDLRPLAETRALWPAVKPAKDPSIRFHIAHSPQREVEILHDQLLAAFDEDPSLRPRDVIVMVPDIETYAPSIQAVFGLLESGDKRYIPFTVADRGRRKVDPLVHAIARLLDLPQSRLAVSDILDWLDVPALRKRFGIAETDLSLLHRWISGANIRWGLHTEHRASLELPGGDDPVGQNSWLFGLRRMLLGYAMGADAEDWHGIEPYDEIGGLDGALLGPLIRLLDLLESTWQTLREPATANVWCERFRQLMADFFEASDRREGYTLMELESALQGWQQACVEAELTDPLPLSVVGEYWLSRLDEQGLSQRFFGGAVTFATLMPMRAIPFRRVCLLGMNDGDYPRSRKPLDFDLMGRDYRPGDRSRREDDRYLFLEALLSAREHLHISWVGHSINDNSERPASVLVAQLRDHLKSGWRLSGYESHSEKAGASLLDALTTTHRLQPFNPEYFTARAGLFSYAREWCPAAPAVSIAADSGTLSMLPPLQREEPLTLRELGDFLKEPVKAFFRQRLNVSFERAALSSEDQEPFALDGLQQWLLQDELIRTQAAVVMQSENRGGGGASPELDERLELARMQRVERIRRRGELAGGGFGDIMAGELMAPMDDLFSRYREALAEWPQRVEGELEIHHAIEIAGLMLEVTDWLGGIRMNARGERGRVVLESSDVVKDGQYRGEKLVRHWVNHLALHLAGETMTTRVISKLGDVTLQPIDSTEAGKLFDDILSHWYEGMRRPLPLAVRTAFVWLNKADQGATLKAYEGTENSIGEVQTDAYQQRAYPDYAALSRSGEFYTLAEALLRPLQQAIHVNESSGANNPSGVAAA
ncbi:MAG: exodeoxyribonuclease V subunit gamma, partial [Methylococcaceae bacterium]|nr:exodeoxyribonuclease V subunit gamma [Methylococcaceae bacterium]